MSLALARPMPARSVPASPETASGDKRIRLLRALLLVLPALGALVLWRLSLRQINTANLNSYGLPPALPKIWYAALAVSVIGAGLIVNLRHFNGWVVAIYIIVIATILYGSVAAISTVPHYSWIYKHFGVTRFLEVHGQASKSVDIYNRWPGFFALAAVFSRLSGRLNPEAYASWAELFFTLFDGVLIAAAVRTVSRSGRIAAGAVLIFTVGNWVGQQYYSPQAFGFGLSLCLLLIVLRQFLIGGQGPAKRLTRIVERLSHVQQLPAPYTEASSWPKWTGPVAVIVLDAVVVGSHQLTPYMLLVQMLVLILTGLIRPRWFVAVMALMTFAYLFANLGYIQHNFRVFSSVDPFNNVQHSAIYDKSPEAGKSFNARSGQVLSFSIWIGSGIAALMLVRRGLFRHALPLMLLVAAPFALVFGQNYGGEATLRVILFSLPWCSALIAWAVATLRMPVMRMLLTVFLIGVFTALFVPAFLGQEELNIMPADEVVASNWFYAHAPKGSVLMQAAPDFPARYGPRYPDVIGPQSDDDPNILRTEKFRHKELGPADLPDVEGVIRQYSRNDGYLVFAATETEYSKVFRLTPKGALASLERAVVASPQFRLVYSAKDTRIYRLLPKIHSRALRVSATTQKRAVPPVLARSRKRHQARKKRKATPVLKKTTS